MTKTWIITSAHFSIKCHIHVARLICHKTTKIQPCDTCHMIQLSFYTPHSNISGKENYLVWPLSNSEVIKMLTQETACRGRIINLEKKTWEWNGVKWTIEWTLCSSIRVAHYLSCYFTYLFCFLDKACINSSESVNYCLHD